MKQFNILIKFLLINFIIFIANSETTKEEIINSKNIELWDKLTEEIVKSDEFKSKFKKSKTSNQWVKTLNNIEYWDKLTKSYVLGAIEVNLPKIKFKDILENKIYNPFTIDEILEINVGGKMETDKNGNIKLIDNENIKDTLTNRAIKFIKQINEIKIKRKELNKLIEKRDRLLKEQSKKIEIISKNVENSKEKVIEGSKNIEKSQELKTKSDKKKIYIVVAIFVIFIIFYIIKKLI